ncbi:PREDICTED: putative clathrin assembly protein At2g01600 [Camelina sativa]|uniref:Clathrin assembly protein At2g01600 n=1 Tax=Camelina sativa TaxID=90675 RepID=A0ABM0TDW7_CAMSA|nr:PREDICTED: putative clathrin assembly protein At2g01600 [Camelina sativa]
MSTAENEIDLQQNDPMAFSLPPYPKMIMDAIEASNDPNGCNKTAISKHIESTQITLPPSHNTLLNYHLNHMKQTGQLVIVKNNYMKPNPNGPPKRGRGRPPKPKPDVDPSHAAAVPAPPASPPRPRGRPPKSKESQSETKAKLTAIACFYYLIHYFMLFSQPPQSFLTTMEEYIKEAPRVVDVPAEPLLLTYRPDDGLTAEDTEPSHEEREVLPSDDVVVVSEETEPSPPPPPSASTQNFIDTDDLLGLNSAAPDASVIEDQNALALAIISTDANPSTPGFGQANDYDPTGWELALVTAPSSDISAATERKLAGGLDTLTLSSLYDDGAYIASQRPVYGAPAPNPFASHDPFASSNGTTPPPQQQPAVNNPFGAYQPTYQHQPQPTYQHQSNPPPTNNSNPFGNFGEFPVNPVSQQPNTTGYGDFAVNQHNNPFHSTGLL